ncbi:MAG TPA: DUF1003 domain-containing protein [Pyrinomonadaceae bacterium]|nr:DUF1003 domain-containing protein [Pyrinomonadaceae bacterium]
MENGKKNTAGEYLLEELAKLNEIEKKVISSLVKRKPTARNISKEADDERTFGERVADKVAAFGGSWTFIFIFAGILIAWVFLNSFLLLNRAFDPFPYILLNLFLSMIAALQAPIIMMSQNRQAARDRLDAAHDYEVNMKAEMEIRFLHEKLDDLREQKWLQLVEMQQKQIELLNDILKNKKIQ